MKKAIFTLAIGDNPMYQAAILSFQYYAKRVGADLIISDALSYKIDVTNPQFHASPAWAEKLRIGELLNEYDRVLYLDADILISPHAADIFEQFKNPDVIYMLNEGESQDRSAERALIESCLGKVDWALQNGKPIYYNVGVILASKPCKLFDFADLQGLQSVCNRIRFYEQTYFNYLLFKHNLEHEALPSRFNRMDMFGKQGYHQADFIHYAGKGYAKNSRRRDVQYLRDFATMYSGIINDSEIRKLRKLAWERYLDSVYTKYPMPNWLIRLCSEQFVPN